MPFSFRYPDGRSPRWQSLLSAFVLILAIAMGTTLKAQVATGTITGRVTDASGAVVTGASVVLRRTNTGLVVRGVTNGDGIYSFASLQTGPYHLEVRRKGFNNELSDLTLEVGQTQQLDFKLSVGSSDISVTIVADSSVEVDPTTSSLSYVVNAAQVADLPLNGRNPYGLAELAPGILPGGDFGQGVATVRGAVVAAATNNFETNGGVAGANEIMLDGVPITVCCQGQPALTPDVEIVDQFRALTSVAASQYGRSSGGVLNIVTKTGTNKLHGDVYEYFRNDVLDAASFFAKANPLPAGEAARAPHHVNQFGVFAGGPVVIPWLYRGQNRTFFTFAYEGIRNATGNFEQPTVPSLAVRNGIFTEAPAPIYDPYQVSQSGATTTRSLLPAACDPSGNCYPAGRYVSNISPSAQALLALMPLPAVTSRNFSNYSYYNTFHDVDNQFNARLDQNFSSRNRAFLRLTRGFNAHHENDLFNKPDGPNSVDQKLKAYLLGAGDSIVLTSTTLLQFTYGFAYQSNLDIPGNYYHFNAADYGFSGNFASQQQIAGLPYIGINGYQAIGYGIADNAFEHYTHALTAVAVMQKGKHSITTGYEGELIIENDQTLANPVGSFSYDSALTNGPNPNVGAPGGQTQYDAFAAFLLGTPTTVSIQRQESLALSQWYHALFFQDDWRIHPKLTLNLGVRYEIETGFKERHNRWADLDLKAANPLSLATGIPFTGGSQYLGAPGNPSRTWTTAYARVAPRVGLAWAPNPTLVVKGAYGILNLPSSQRLFGAQTLGYSENTSATSTQTGVPAFTVDNPFPNGVVMPEGPEAGTQAGTGSTIYAQRYNDPLPYQQQWNFGIQQLMAKGILLNINYVGSHGVHLPINSHPNDLQPKYWGAVGDQTQVAKLQQAVANPFYGVPNTGALQTKQTVQLAQLLQAYPQYIPGANFGLQNSSITMYYDDIGSLSYNGMQATLNIRRSNNLYGTISYSWSKLLGNVSSLTSGFLNSTGNPAIQNYYVMGRAERSDLATDVPHRLIANMGYLLPFGKGQRFGRKAPKWENEIIGGWRLNTIVSVQSGYPLGFTQISSNAFAGSRPSYNPGVDPLTHGSVHSRLGKGVAGATMPYLNSAAFRTSRSFELGTVPRSDAATRGPLGFRDDVSALKDFPIHGTYRLQFRLEAFNVLNKVDFGLPNAQVGSTAFGTISGQANLPRNVQLALKLFY